ncbi:uncharacterized [Tachysurus ichikawai]
MVSNSYMHGLSAESCQIGYLKKSSQPFFRIDGSTCSDKKLSFKTRTGVRVLTSSKISVLSRKFCLLSVSTCRRWAILAEEIGDWITNAQHTAKPNICGKNRPGIFYSQSRELSALRVGGDPAEQPYENIT